MDKNLLRNCSYDSVLSECNKNTKNFSRSTFIDHQSIFSSWTDSENCSFFFFLPLLPFPVALDTILTYD